MYNVSPELFKRLRQQAGMDAVKLESFILLMKDKWPQLNERSRLAVIGRGIYSYHIADKGYMDMLSGPQFVGYYPVDGLSALLQRYRAKTHKWLLDHYREYRQTIANWQVWPISWRVKRSWLWIPYDIPYDRFGWRAAYAPQLPAPMRTREVALEYLNWIDAQGLVHGFRVGYDALTDTLYIQD